MTPKIHNSVVIMYEWYQRGPRLDRTSLHHGEGDGAHHDAQGEQSHFDTKAVVEINIPMLTDYLEVEF